MNHEVMITCAITGDDTKVTKSPHCPVTAGQIANSAIDAAKAGAAIVHTSASPRPGRSAWRLGTIARLSS
jgi:uncharacterized protein (DUF849 family)